MPWENRDSLLVTREEFEKDMLKSYEAMRKAGIEYKDAPDIHSAHMNIITRR